MRTRSVAIVLALCLLLPVHAAAQETKPVADLKIDLGGRVWVTSGYSTRHIGGGAGRPRSELTWRGVDAIVPEVNVDLQWSHFVVLASVGGGWINDGVFIDNDFASDGTRISHTRSAVEDSNLFYFNADVGGRVVRWDLPRATVPGYIDVLLGFQYWRERYVGFGAAGFPSTGVPSGTKAITNTYEWSSIRVGARTEVPVYRGLSLKLRGFVVPWSALAVEDIHHLRDDLRQDPSFEDEAFGGFGVQLDGAVSYAITNRLSVDLGFQYWMLDVEDGDSLANTTAGTFLQPLKEATTERYGPFLSVRWRF